MTGLSDEDREALWLHVQVVPSNHDRPQIVAAVERIVAAREAKARAELAMVCDAYGLPHSAVALDRHLRNNAAATIENWRHVAEVATARLAAVEALFSGGPDTECRTVWREEPGMFDVTCRVECVEVPMDGLRAALATSPTHPDAEVAAGTTEEESDG